MQVWDQMHDTSHIINAVLKLTRFLGPADGQTNRELTQNRLLKLTYGKTNRTFTQPERLAVNGQNKKYIAYLR